MMQLMDLSGDKTVIKWNPDIAIVDNMMTQFATADRWCKFIQQDDLGRRCLLGALSVAMVGRPFQAEMYLGGRVHHRMVDEAVKRGFQRMTHFNDADATTRADIVDFLGCVRLRLEREASHAV